MWSLETSCGNEAAKIAHLIVPYTRGRGIDVGCGRYKAWPHFIGVDSGKDYGGQPVTDIQSEGQDLALFGDESMDFVFSSHFLEHVVDTKACLKEWWRLIKPDGHLVLYLPHEDLYPRIGEPGSNPDHKHDFSPESITAIMRTVGGWDLIEDEVRSDTDEYSFFQVYRKRLDKAHVIDPWQKPDKSLLIIRYGAFGDQIMASAVLPGLKKQGWHITYQTTPKGHGILANDPNIDAFWLQDDDQVPNDQLYPYWTSLEERFDRVINFCEIVEGTLLTIPGRIEHQWSDDARRKVLNVNYLERHADVAGVSKASLMPRFYPTEDEKNACKEWRADICASTYLLWCLGGSTHHKMWPYVDIVVAWLMQNTDIHIVFAGGPREKILEDEVIEKVEAHIPGSTGRLHRTCGDWDIRTALTFANSADIVAGPETGVLNAVSYLDMPKVVLLSHSSVTNLTRDWNNTISLTGDVPCYPCHRMHYGYDFCVTDEETQAAACAAAITPERVYNAIVKKLGLKHKKAA